MPRWTSRRTRDARIVLEQARGADFATLAHRWSEDPATVLTGGSVGQQTAVKLGPVVGEAVFAAGADGITDILDTARGLEIVKVHEVTEAKVVSLEDATDTIAQELVAKDSVDAFADELAESIRSTWETTGAPPADVLEKYGLLLSEPDLTSKAEQASWRQRFGQFHRCREDRDRSRRSREGLQADDARIVGSIRDYQQPTLPPGSNGRTCSWASMPARPVRTSCSAGARTQSPGRPSPTARPSR